MHDLVVKDDDLVVGTHGRSIWVLDDLQPVREMSAEIAKKDVHLFASPDAIRWRLGSRSWGGGYGRFSNPPLGATIYYFLKEKIKGEVKIEVLDASNRVVRTASSVPRPSDKAGDEDDTEDLKKAALPVGEGLHRAEWDLRWEGAKKIYGAKIDFGDPAEGPRAVPGPYTVRLTVDGKTQTTPLKVVADPRGTVSQADLDAQLAFALRVRDAITRLTELVHSVRSAKEQLAARESARGAKGGSAGRGAAQGVGGGGEEGGRARGPHAQPEGRGHLRHPRRTRRHAPLFAALTPAHVGGRGTARRPAACDRCSRNRRRSSPNTNGRRGRSSTPRCRDQRHGGKAERAVRGRTVAAGLSPSTRYSARSVIAGSIVAARSAGTVDASAATGRKSAATAA